MNKTLWIIAIFLGFNNSIFSQNNYIKDASYIQEYPFLNATNAMINTLTKDPALRNANWGFSLYDPFTDKELIAKDSYDNYIPASTTKLISSESALRLLGENFNWKTEIAYTGFVDADGILQGNIYIIWNGDPTLGLTSINAKGYNELFLEAYQGLQSLGVKNIHGKIIFESVVFKSDKSLYPFDERMIEFENYYSLIPTENEELTDNEKEFNEKITASQESVEDAIDEEEMSVEDIIMKDVIETIELNNKLNNLQSIGLKNASLAPPPSWFTQKFSEYLSVKGIKASGGKVQQNYLDLEIEEPRHILMYYESPPLKDLIYMVDKRSNNTYAEHLMRNIGIFIGKRDSKWSSAQTVMKRLEDVNYFFNGLNYVDGSGLSYDHRVSPIAQVKYLSMIKFQPYFQSFYSSLPIGGVDGTLRNSFKNSPHLGSIHAKTGTLNSKVRTKTLAGYITLENGQQLVFSLLINHYTGSVYNIKQKMESLLNTVY